MSKATRSARGPRFTQTKQTRSRRSSRHTRADDYFVGVYVTTVELEAHIHDGPVNPLGTPLILSHLQQSLF